MSRVDRQNAVSRKSKISAKSSRNKRSDDADRSPPELRGLSPLSPTLRSTKQHAYSFPFAGSPSLSSSESSSVGSILKRLSLRLRKFRGTEAKETLPDTTVVQTHVRGARSRTRKCRFKHNKTRPDRVSCETAQADPGVTSRKSTDRLTECSPEDYVSIIQELQAFDVQETVVSTKEPGTRRRSESNTLYREYAQKIISQCNPESLLRPPPRKRSPVG